jgi:hypothetical protein
LPRHRLLDCLHGKSNLFAFGLTEAQETFGQELYAPLSSPPQDRRPFLRGLRERGEPGRGDAGGRILYAYLPQKVDGCAVQAVSQVFNLIEFRHESLFVSKANHFLDTLLQFN